MTAGVAFLASIIIFLIGISKKKRMIMLFSVGVFLLSAVFAIIAISSFTKKTYKAVKDLREGPDGLVKPRTGDQIYDAILGKKESDCVTVFNHKDQVIPLIDKAILLHVNTCPEEMQRILARRYYEADFISSESLTDKPTNDSLAWFNPKSLGDSINVYLYISPNSNNSQTIWTNREETEAFVSDVAH